MLYDIVCLFYFRNHNFTLNVFCRIPVDFFVGLEKGGGGKKWIEIADEKKVTFSYLIYLNNVLKNFYLFVNKFSVSLHVQT